MSHRVTCYRCLIISPGDVIPERDAISAVIDRWNGKAGRLLKVSIDPVMWEQHATPDLRVPAQQAINDQLLDDCDLGLAVFWSRVGTPT